MSSNQESKAHSELSPDLALRVAFGNNVSNLQHWLVQKEPDVDRLSVKRDEYGEWRAVFCVWGEDGGPLVAFGSGPTFFAALYGLSRTIAAGRFKPDKYRTGT